ncbi:hypothetical protein GCM10010517_45130 [Streptosporangium fragile]|uniref:DNA primase n=1 Tax=Streptosporangium fragile TaxID=46186 RepID=A0ABN3W2K6_9ACTN
MNNGARVALAVAAGYLLGRRQKLRLAMALAAAGATGRLSAGQGNLIQQALNILNSSPELAKITQSVRGDLVDAGRAAARTAVSRQIDSLSGRLHDRAESLRSRERAGVVEEPEEIEEGVEAVVGEEPAARGRRLFGGRRKARPAAEEEAREEEGAEEPEEEEEEEKPARKPAATRGRTGAAAGRGRTAAASRRRSAGEEEGEEEEGEEEPAPPRRRAGTRTTATATRSRAATSRTRR